MDNVKVTYLSLGSNKGDKGKILQLACDLISNQIGVLQRVSSVYQTESWGFASADFFNICLKVNTRLSVHLVLEKILKIESDLGRERAKSNTYQARTIDIDILFYGNKDISSKTLTIPHPKLVNRLFVLKPLHDIAPKLVHPLLGKTIETLLEESEDKSRIRKVNLEILLPKSIANEYNYIAIEGNIGAGKTTLTNMLAADFNAKEVLERFADNPFLPKFYEDKDRFAFPLEMSFLADRYQQLSDDLAQFDLFKSFIISDYYIFKSLIFAQVTLADDEYRLYRKMFDIMYKEITKPDLYIYLYQNTDRLLENIKKRGRDYEQNIKANYLTKIHKGYANFVNSEKNLNTLIIDVSSLDFVTNYEDYHKIITQIIAYKS